MQIGIPGIALVLGGRPSSLEDVEELVGCSAFGEGLEKVRAGETLLGRE